MPHREQRRQHGIKFQAGLDTRLEPNPILFNLVDASEKKRIFSSNWSVEEAEVMAAGLLKYIELAKKHRADRAKAIQDPEAALRSVLAAGQQPQLPP